VTFAAIDGVWLVESALCENGEDNCFISKIKVSDNSHFCNINGGLAGPVRLITDDIYFPFQARLFDITELWCSHDVEVEA
jgi:hypothetical protein